MHVPVSLSPFSHAAYAWLWTGNTVSAVGTWMKSTAAAWVMTQLAPDPLMVSLIQAASQLPFLLLVLPAGALADLVDRRRYLVWTNLGMLAVSGTLAALYAFGPVSAVVLLLLTAALACFAALNSPAWASSVPLTVPRTELPQALVLNSIGFNIARAVGPAIGGFILATSGAALAFACNAASFVVIAIIVGFFLSFPRPQQPADLPPEPVMQAVGLGVRYAMAEPSIRAALVRSAVFYGSASAIWALLPLYVHDVLGQSSATYGLMLGAIGAGAILGGAVMPALRERLQRDTLVLLAGLVTSAVLIPVALYPTTLVAGLAMVIFGVGWIAGASSLQTTVQLACAPWVRARGLAMYQAVLYGGMGIGAIAWGWLGTHAGLTGTLLAAGLSGVVVAVLARAQSLPRTIADPAAPAARELPSIEVHDSIASFLVSARHPVLVTITYRIEASDVEDFRAALDDLRLARQRDGAVAWLVARDVEHPEQWVEAFRVPDWHELRRGMARVNLLDDEASQAVRALHRGEAPPSIRVLVTDSTLNGKGRAMAALAGISRIRLGLAAWLLAIAAISPSGGAAGQTLVDAFVSTYNSNPDLLAQRARLRVVDETVSRGMAGRRPVIRGQGAYGVNTPDRRLPQIPQTLQPRGYGLSATQPVYRGGKTVASIRGAEADVLAERAVLLDRGEQAVLLGAVSAYSDTVRDVATVQLRRNNVRALQQQLAATNARFRVGQLTRADVAQAELRLARSRSDFIATQAQAAISRANSQRVVGHLPRPILQEGR